MSNEKIKDSVSAEHVPDASSLKADQQDVQRGYELLELEREASLVQASIANYRILLHCLAAFCAGMVFGYDSIVNGASISMPSFLLYFGSTAKDGSAYLPSIWTSLWTAMSALLQALGGFGIGLVSDRVGRKWPCVGACVVSIGGVAMQYWATSRGLLLGGKMLNGLAIGCLTATSTAWAADVAPPRLRGPIQSCIVLFTVIMQAIGLIVVRMYVGDITERSFRHVFAIQWAWAILTAIVFAFMPESPTWLLLHDNIAETEKTLTLLYGSQNAIPARLAVLRSQIRQETLAAQEQGAGTYMDAFKGSNLRRTLTVMWIFIGVGLNGASLLSQNIYFLIVAGLEPIHCYDVGIGGFGLAVVAIIASWFYMEKFGRRSLWLIGAAGNFIAMLIIGALYYAHNGASLWAIAIVMNVLLSWQIVTMTSTGWAITGEISSYRMRGKTQSIAVIASAFATWFFIFTVPYIYNVDAGNLGARAGFVFAGSSVVLFGVSYFIIPDLRGFNVEGVDMLYENKIPPRHFQSHGRAFVAAPERV